MKLLKEKTLRKIKRKCKKIKNHKLWLYVIKLLDMGFKAKRMKRSIKYLNRRTKGDSKFPLSCVYEVTQAILEHE